MDSYFLIVFVNLFILHIKTVHKESEHLLKANNKKHKASAKKDSTFWIWALIGVFLLSMVGLAVYKTSGSGASEKEPISYVNQPSMGEADAPVVITEFADFKCPYCKVWTEEVFPQLEQDYIMTGKVRFYFKNYAFIAEDSLTAASAGEAILRQDPNAFWDYYSLMFKNQGDERTAWANKKSILEMVEKNIPSVDVKRLSKEMSDGDVYSEVLSDNKQARDNGIESTPSILIDGELLADPYDYEAIKAIIDAKLEQVKQ